MNEKLLKIYDKCMEHNISISVRYLLSHAEIEVTGVMLSYERKTKKYIKLECSKSINIHEMREVIGVDLLTLAIDKIFNELTFKKNELLEV